MELGGDSGFFTVDAAWNFGEGKDWSYYVEGERPEAFGRLAGAWDPQTCSPDLGNGRTVRYDRTDAAPPKVSTARVPLMNEQTINAITLDPTGMPARSTTTERFAQALEPVAPFVTSDLDAAESRPTRGSRSSRYCSATRLPIPRKRSRRASRASSSVKTPKLIATDRRIDTPLLDPLRTVWQANRDATAGWAVNLVESNGFPIKQAGFQGPPGPDVAATLDSHAQLAAIEAVVSAGTPAAIVAIRPSDGAILAAAQNNQAIEQGPIAFTGLRPAGGALDLVRFLLLEAAVGGTIALFWVHLRGEVNRGFTLFTGACFLVCGALAVWLRTAFPPLVCAEVDPDRGALVRRRTHAEHRLRRAAGGVSHRSGRPSPGAGLTRLLGPVVPLLGLGSLWSAALVAPSPQLLGLGTPLAVLAGAMALGSALTGAVAWPLVPGRADAVGADR